MSFVQQQQQQTIFISDKNLHFNLLTGPWIASASLEGPVHQDKIKYSL